MYCSGILENMKASRMSELDEEFNNFMYKVTEVNEIVKKLNSKDETVAQIGTIEAEKYLNGNAEAALEKIDDDDIVLRVTSKKAMINPKALLPEKDENTMSQESFMTEVSKDADMRYKNRLLRKERMETFKKQATLAFRRGDYERALCCYNKAIEQIKDSPLLYNNRCLTFLKLKLYDKAISDAETALRLNENCLKSYLFIAKANYLSDNLKEFSNAIEKAKCIHPNMVKFIEEFVVDLKREHNDISMV
ncbi:PREDICTED: tetratricopeptide repeat protein 12-like [Nicrophorus vespilloides]|uniref:Tetratricopeptide repeat protein 12-like n=1 Tax=Nicrophorus vespilloides TaxID=110193 RepID=A0ABM1NCI9_NICVS|nr:PREDICTED: tetratricopeptide repeat protein 12-like [Nicrophorus vespilloides]